VASGRTQHRRSHELRGRNSEKFWKSTGIRSCFSTEIQDLASLKRIQKKIFTGKSRASFLREHRSDKANLAAEIHSLVENTTNYTNKERIEATDTYARMGDMVNGLAENYSVILRPSAVDEAPLGLGDMGVVMFNTLWTASTFCSLYSYCFSSSLTSQQGFHMPLVNIPAFIGVHGMPVGISFVAPRFSD
jgi:Asp-tRNA(Asn)/Glu-tRNA(Gln) amidotransferase A subunit family amidase